MRIIDFSRYRDGKPEGEGNTSDGMQWRYSTNDESGPELLEEGFPSLAQAVAGYFEDIGHPGVELNYGVAFPGGHGALKYVTDDLYRIEVDDA